MATERYPTYRSGQILTATLLTAAQPMTARKTVDTTRASTTTPTADPELQLAVVANAVYTMNGFIKYAATATADLSVDWSAPTGSEGEWMGGGIGLGTSATTTNGYLVRLESRDVITGLSWAGVGSTDAMGVVVSGMLRTGSTAGTYSFDWSQVTNDVVAATVFSDSWLRLQRIA